MSAVILLSKIIMLTWSDKVLVALHKLFYTCSEFAGYTVLSPSIRQLWHILYLSLYMQVYSHVISDKDNLCKLDTCVKFRVKICAHC